MSKYTLGLHGGTMTAQQAEAFAALSYAAGAAVPRRWDDLAKDPSAGALPFDHYVPALERLLTGE